jgi:hypothetical protein
MTQGTTVLPNDTHREEQQTHQIIPILEKDYSCIQVPLDFEPSLGVAGTNSRDFYAIVSY